MIYVRRRIVQVSINFALTPEKAVCVLHFHVLQFHCLAIWSVIFTSDIFSLLLLFWSINFMSCIFSQPIKLSTYYLHIIVHCLYEIVLYSVIYL